MLGAIITLTIIIVLLEIYRSIFSTLQYFETKKTNVILTMDSSQLYLSAVKGQKINKPILPSRRNGIPMQEVSDDPTSDIDNGINLLTMDPEEGYQAIVDTMGVKE